MRLPTYLIRDRVAINRRSFIATSSLAAASLWSSRAIGAVRANLKFSDYPFQLGVASGDPTPDGVVLWTRLAPKPLENGGMPDEPVEVSWQISEDEAMTRPVRRGTTFAVPDWAHSVHVEVDGLEPDRWYWYQFQAGGEVSPKGRTRTMPPAESESTDLRFAFASCQHYEAGYFTAYEHMAREDLDLVVHLGDYIYEGDGRDRQVRKHIGPELYTLDEYRNRHAQYKTDTALQAMHAQAPWIVTWDDHEFDNNCAGEISEEDEINTDEFLKRRARAYKVYYEHMPLRRSSLPDGPHMQLFRRISFGRLAEFFVLDTRQFRTDQPCGDGNRPPCEDSYAENGSILGEIQRGWLFQGLSQSRAKWNVLAQQVMMARVDRTPGETAAYSMDQWPGYEFERRRVLSFLRERGISNPVVLAGDIHSNWANELSVDLDGSDAVPVAAEFVGTSITSGGDGTAAPRNLDRLLGENPFVKFHNAERGYVRCRISAREWRTDYQVVEYVSRPGAALTTRKSYVIEDGRPELKEV